ncbi:MAG: cation:proton antiporter [Candidatus Aminicenantes bacterium]
MTILPMAVIFLIMAFLKAPFMESYINPGKSTSIALGFILVFAFLAGKNINRIKLPQITGFLLAGILCGPYLMNFISLNDVKDLQLLDGLALSLIALAAGGEMKIAQLRGRIKGLSSIVVLQTFMILGGFIAFGLAFAHLFGIFSGKSIPEIISISLLMGTLATATSPSTTLAVLTETGSRGKLSDLILSSAVVKDFFIIGLFAFSLTFSKSLISKDQHFDFGFVQHIFKEIGGSVLIGVIVGITIILYMKYVKRKMTVFILAAAFLSYQITHNYGFHPLLICLIAGFIVQNFSSHGGDLITALENVSLPVYVIFFAISGASLNLDALRQSWMLALVLVFWRGLLKYAGTFLGAKFSGEDRYVQKWGWSGFISQAGVALGMIIVIDRNFPDWGDEFRTVMLAVIAINQIVGPIMLQRLLIKSGETGQV